MALNKIKQGSIGQSAVTSDNIVDGTIVNADISPSAAIASSKVPGIATLCTTASNISATVGGVEQNIALLGFKMAVNDGLTVFNLVDGVVDEFHDESGTDEAEGSNDLYNATDDYYINSTTPDGASTPGAPAGFSGGHAITEPETSAVSSQTGSGTYTVQPGNTSLTIQAWGAGGSKGYGSNGGKGGGGGFASGTLAVTAGQVIHVFAGEAGLDGSPQGGLGGLGPCLQGGGVGEGTGGGAAIISTTALEEITAAPQAPAVVVVGAGGGGGGGCDSSPNRPGGAGGGLIGDGGAGQTERNSGATMSGGGGSQTAGGEASTCGGNDGSFLRAGAASGLGGGGGGGYYGGGGGGNYPISPNHGGGGGGSSYYGHPQITSGATEEGAGQEGGGTAAPNYQSSTNEGADYPGESNGEDGYVMITSSPVPASATSTTIVSAAFSAGSVPTTSRIVVFEENVATPTLNTDIIASISRNGGSNFTTATLSDSGYVTGSSGQRILTGQATISGQPSGQSMRWKLALANNAVKIHGVALQWS